MKKYKKMLLGLLVIALGNSAATLVSWGGEDIDFLILIGMFAPIIGLIIFFYGFFMKENVDDVNSEEKQK